MLTVSGRVEPGSLLSKLCNCSSSERDTLLNSSAHLNTIYEKAALRGSTSPPPAQDEVDLHYVCFIKSPNGSIYEMDGDASGPVKTDITLKQDEDILEMSALECVKRCVAREDADGKFSLLALVQISSASN
jgi:ubiquitin carboxyl-terminal hydrolase L3